MSMGLLLGDDSPVIVRGPIATRYTQQFLRQVAWDNSTTSSSTSPLALVTSNSPSCKPSPLDGADHRHHPSRSRPDRRPQSRRHVCQSQRPILGIVENMSHFVCPNDGTIYHIFGQGGGEHEAKRLGVPLLAQIPIEVAVREAGDSGHPIALKAPAEHPASAAFQKLAHQVRALTTA
jgi:ATP-binding protein involved in chromosome partitioning